MKIPHHHWEGMRSQSRAQDVVSRSRRSDPVSHGFIHGILQRPLARFDRAHLRAAQPHPEDIEGLALHIHRTHINDTFQAELCTSGRRGHAMLARTCFRDDPGLAQSLRQKDLPNDVVDLMGPSVKEVFPLQINPRSAKTLRQLLGEIELCRAPRVVLEKPLDLLIVFRIGPSNLVSFLQIEERRHQRFRHIATPIGTEVPGSIGKRCGINKGLGFHGIRS